MPIHELKDQIARLPEQPGVYLYFNAAGDTIYVGKARALRDRVRNYLGAYGSDPKTDALLDEVARLEVIVTDSVVEALALENNLIKQRTPKYNILLRDDKNYPYLQLTTNEAFPRVLVARRVERDGSFYAGPFLPAHFARKTMSLTHRLFGIRSCNEVITGKRDRPCLEYDIKRCIAPCVDTICSPAEYGRAVALTQLFLEGKNDELVEDAAGADGRGRRRRALRGGGAAARRDAHGADAARSPAEDGDGRARPPRRVRPEARSGRRRRSRSSRCAAAASSSAIELGTEDADRRRRATARCSRRRSSSSTSCAARRRRSTCRPSRTSARRSRRGCRSAPAAASGSSCRSAARSAASSISRTATPRSRIRRGSTRRTAAQYDALETLQHVLALPALPRRIECFDISTIQGSETVASMVVCEDGRMRRGGVSEVPHPRGLGHVGHSGFDESRSGELAEPRISSRRLHDDFAAMHEVVLRRYRKLLEQGGPFPDLVLIDGGKGQLSAAYAALEELGLANLVAVGIAKKEELLFTRDRDDPIALAANDPALLLLQRIRDEAHRFAVTFHRRARTMRDLRSELDDVPGIGPRRRRTLLTTFGSLAGVRRATREELAAAVGAKVADAVLAFFASRP